MDKTFFLLNPRKVGKQMEGELGCWWLRLSTKEGLGCPSSPLLISLKTMLPSMKIISMLASITEESAI